MAQHRDENCRVPFCKECLAGITGVLSKAREFRTAAEEKDTPKEAANELEEKVDEVLFPNDTCWHMDGNHCGSCEADCEYADENGGSYYVDKCCEHLAMRSQVISLIESEKLKAVEEYRQRLNAYWPEGSEEPTLTAEQIKQILDKVQERN